MRNIILSLVLVCVCTSVATAQPVLTPRNMALGGGGSTYITDYNANFYNPANLMIQERSGNFDVGVAVGGFYFDGVTNRKAPIDQLQNAWDYIGIYSPSSSSTSRADRAKIIENHYPRNTSISTHRTRYDATLLGMKWKSSNRAISLTFRTRTSSSFSVGKGWYSREMNSRDGDVFLDRTLIHRYQSLHEVSFGYAESFQFLTNLTSRLDNFVIGIAPKLVFGGSYQDAVWENEYVGSGNNYAHNTSFSYTAAGDFGSAATHYVRDSYSPQQGINNGFDNDPFKLNGIGAGLDIGVTYLLTFGSDLSILHPENQPTRKSLRLSFSMTDIGLVSYSDNELSLTVNSESSNLSSLPNTLSDEAFIGMRGQFLAFTDRMSESANPFKTAGRDYSTFSVLLPIALHGGAMFEANRVKIMGDLSVGLTNNAFNSTTLLSSVGVELRPFSFLPLRAGTQFEAQRPRFISAGTAIETKYWDFSIAAQFTPESLVSKVEFSGISLATLQFHF